MTQQNARILINAQALVGATVTITSARGSPLPLQASHDAILNLRPGDKITIEVASDERWLEAQKAEHKRLAAVDAETVAAGKAGMTLGEGLAAADRDQPNVEAGTGAVASDDGAQVTRTTPAAPASTGTTSTTRATRSTKS